MRRPLVVSLGLAVVALSACKKTTDGPIPLCASEVEGGEAEEAQSQNVPPEIWFALVLKDFNVKTGEPKRPALDCTNRPLEIQDESVARCVLSEEPEPALPYRALDGEQDLELVGLDDGRVLVWVRTGYYADGDALGPIAIAEYRPNGIAIRALGSLRANPNRVRMRLEPMGERSVLVVESMVCPPDDPAKCARVMRILPLEGSRFVERPLLDESDACLGPATFAMSRDFELVRDDGTVRRFELARTFDFEEGDVTVNEQVTIKDVDPEQPDAPPAVFRKAQIERTLRLKDGGLRTTAPLWERMMAEHGSVQVRSEQESAADDSADGAGSRARPETVSGWSGPADTASASG